MKFYVALNISEEEKPEMSRRRSRLVYNSAIKQTRGLEKIQFSIYGVACKNL